MNDHLCNFVCEAASAYSPADPGTSERHPQAAQGEQVNQLRVLNINDDEDGDN